MKRLNSRTSRIARLSISFILLSLSCTQNDSRPDIDPTGLYLSVNHIGYIEISRDQYGDLSARTHEKAPTFEFEGDRLVMTSGFENPKTAKLVFTASKTIPGDWDLVEHDFIEDNEQSPKLAKPIASYLHRVDPALHQYFGLLDAVMQTTDTTKLQVTHKQLVETANQLIGKYPNDVFLRVILYDALVRNKDAARLKQELTRNDAAMRKLNNPYLIQWIEYAKVCIRVFEHGNGDSIWNPVREALNKDFAAQWAMAQSFPDNPGTHEVGFANISGNAASPFETMLRTIRTQATMALLTGKRAEAQKGLTSICMISQSMIYEGDLINRIVGTSCRAISVRGLEFYALNFSDSPEDFQELWTALERLNAAYTQPSEEEMLACDMGPLMKHYNETDTYYQTYTRSKFSNALFQNLRMATAARMRLLTTGKFPTNNTEFGPLLPVGPPLDPFTSAPLKMISTPEKFTAYSVGPDETDDRAQITYDPTNGTLSAGDVILEVPRARKYPVPPGGLRGTVDDIDHHMPHGLPTDPFMAAKGSPFGIAETSSSLIIYSYGPDEAHPTGQFIQYDPTNGTKSVGDLIMEVPK